MSDPNERDAKLVQYLNEAHAKEQELITALQVDIAVTTKKPYKKRLQQHLRETKGHAKELERRIKKLGGGPSALQTVVAKTKAVAKGPVHALRGSGEQETMLKNAKTQYFNEHEEISTYLALENFATRVKDSETARLAREIRKSAERMARFLEGQVKSLAGATALELVPAAQRRRAAATRVKKTAAAKPRAAKAKSAKPKAAKAKTGKAKTAPKKRKSAKAKTSKVKATKSRAAKPKSAKAKKPAKAKKAARK